MYDTEYYDPIAQAADGDQVVGIDQWERFPSREQMTCRRHLQWLFEHEVGAFDPIDRRFKRRSVAELAVFYGVTERAIRHGLAVARELDTALSAALAEYGERSRKLVRTW